VIDHRQMAHFDPVPPGDSGHRGIGPKRLRHDPRLYLIRSFPVAPMAIILCENLQCSIHGETPS